MSVRDAIGVVFISHGVSITGLQRSFTTKEKGIEEILEDKLQVCDVCYVRATEHFLSKAPIIKLSGDETVSISMWLFQRQDLRPRHRELNKS